VKEGREGRKRRGRRRRLRGRRRSALSRWRGRFLKGFEEL